ncbi:hypothetical protein UPYG_G00194210 [Umbra pygmaea]|uniref:Tumor protein p53-inducible protein 13 n=1 Tax=Umbra pygmaea TaxID=75934 RepID=A0ABD0WGS2_UMBPY
MCPSVAPLLAGLGLCLGLSVSTWTVCDNGKMLLERDLPSSVVWSCPGIGRSEFIIKMLPSVDTKYSTEPTTHICMDTPITYNQTIPNSGASRLVTAESGEYLYCPPQRWINNLQHGATVLLYHPCTDIRQHQRLSALAHFCLSDYILTPHSNLSTARPLALVSWGRTLELSQVTMPEVCDWLQSTVAWSNHGIPSQSRKYSLLLTRPAEHKHTYAKQQVSLKECCEKTLSVLLGREEEETSRGPLRLRRRRAVLQEHSTDEAVGGAAVGGAAVGGAAVGGAAAGGTQGKPDIVVPPLLGENDANEKQLRGKTGPTDSLKRNQVGDRMQPGAAGDAPEMEESSRKARGQKQRRKTPTQTQVRPLASIQTNSRADCGSERCNDTVAELGGAVAGHQNRMTPTPRTDEAVWAAAALGFLLVLLVLSVLHTRLYRHWHTMPSMYWHDPTQDYDLVADVIQRRLKMQGRRKRRLSQSRRHEYVLLPPSSSTEEDE